MPVPVPKYDLKVVAMNLALESLLLPLVFHPSICDLPKVDPARPRGGDHRNGSVVKP